MKISLCSRLTIGVALGACCLFISAIACAQAVPKQALPGLTIYVNNSIGSDSFDGSAAKPARGGKIGPYATIVKAYQLATVGAHISIANTGSDYRETVRIEKLNKGRANAPLVIEGNGATVTGLLVIPANRWTLLKDDIYWYDGKIADGVRKLMPNSNWLGFTKHQGWFAESQAPRIFFLNGQAAPDVLELAAIPQGGFFYDTQVEPRRVYFRLPAAKALQDCRLELPQNEGVYINDDYVTIRNLASKYSMDDGFSGFGAQGVVLQNINGSFNCDQGVSFHHISTTFIDGGLIEHNGGCGIADVQSCISIYRNVMVRDNMFNGALLSGTAHTMMNCRINGNADEQVAVTAGASVNLSNCLIIGSGKPGWTSVGAKLNYGRLDHCTIINCDIGVKVEQRPWGQGASLRSCIISDCNTLISVVPENIKGFDINNTVLKLGAVKIGDAVGTADNWAQYCKDFSSKNVTIGNPQLQSPLYQLPKDSPFARSGEFQSAPGATLAPYEGWTVLGE